MDKKTGLIIPSKVDDLKSKFAQETGFDIAQYGKMDKANLTSRQNGYVGGILGGTMTKKLAEMGKEVEESR